MIRFIQIEKLKRCSSQLTLLLGRMNNIELLIFVIFPCDKRYIPPSFEVILSLPKRRGGGGVRTGKPSSFTCQQTERHQPARKTIFFPRHLTHATTTRAREHTTAPVPNPPRERPLPADKHTLGPRPPSHRHIQRIHYDVIPRMRTKLPTHTPRHPHINSHTPLVSAQTRTQSPHGHVTTSASILWHRQIGNLAWSAPPSGTAKISKCIMGNYRCFGSRRHLE